MASIEWGEGKMQRPPDQEQEHSRLVGCGDPNCDICNPKDGKGGKAPGGFSPGGFVISSEVSARSFRSAFFLGGLRFTIDEVTEQAAPPKDVELSKARTKVEQYILKTAHTVGWHDVVGNERARTAMLEAIEHPFTHAALYRHYGITVSKGVLLWGPPGCGKTMLGKAAAAAIARLHETDAAELLVINGPEIQSPWVGKTEETIRDIFAYARLYKKKHGHPLVIFVDEADAILPSREGRPMWNASNVATFLTEMDGMEESGAFVILATNRPDTLDAALLRDGRCDRKIKVERPSYDDALVLAGKHLTADAPWLGGVGAADMIDYLYDPTHLLMPLTNPDTKTTHHFTLSHTVSGAMIVGLINRAKGIAFRRDMAAGKITGLTVADMRAAVDEVFHETKGLSNDYALKEFVETVAIPYEEAKRLKALN